MAGIKKRITTRHSSTLNHDFHPKSVKYDKFINKLATHIIANSYVTQKVLVEREKVPADKIAVIYYNVNITAFAEVNTAEVALLKNKYLLTTIKRPLIGVISRYTYWKGHDFILQAYHKILKRYPDALLIIANAQGQYRNDLEKYFSTLPKDSFLEIPFENNIPALFKIFDIFIHVPVSSTVEAFGQVYVEALASGVPSIVTLSGIANDIIKNDHNALVVAHEDADSIVKAFEKLMQNSELSDNLVANGRKSIEGLFSLEKEIAAIQKVYSL